MKISVDVDGSDAVMTETDFVGG